LISPKARATIASLHGNSTMDNGPVDATDFQTSVCHDPHVSARNGLFGKSNTSMPLTDYRIQALTEELFRVGAWGPFTDPMGVPEHQSASAQGRQCPSCVTDLHRAMSSSPEITAISVCSVLQRGRHNRFTIIGCLRCLLGSSGLRGDAFCAVKMRIWLASLSWHFHSTRY
jgi:hypothetical protein